LSRAQVKQPNATYFAKLALWGRGVYPAAGFPAGAFCDEFAVIQRQKFQLRSKRELGRKAEALPHRPFRHKVRGIGLATRLTEARGKKYAASARLFSAACLFQLRWPVYSDKYFQVASPPNQSAAPSPSSATRRKAEPSRNNSPGRNQMADPSRSGLNFVL
jgi:hypothetical protein